MKFVALFLVLVAVAHSNDRLSEVPMFSFEQKKEMNRDSVSVKNIPGNVIVINADSLEVPFEKVAWENNKLLNEEYSVIQLGIHY